MRYQRCSALLSATILAFGNSRCRGNAAVTDEVDLRDTDLEDMVAGSFSLTELAQLEQNARAMADQKDGTDETFNVDDDDEAEDEQAAVSGTLGKELDVLEDLDIEELEEAGEEEQVKNTEERNTSSASSTFIDGSHGGMVQTQDEEGTTLDTSTLSHDGDAGTPTISEFIDATPKFKKEEEDKIKKKEEAKERKRINNDMYEYEAEIRTFLEAQEKNKERFKDGIENAEVELQAPKKPSWWKRLKHWYNMLMNDLNEKYASENVE